MLSDKKIQSFNRVNRQTVERILSIVNFSFNSRTQIKTFEPPDPTVEFLYFPKLFSKIHNIDKTYKIKIFNNQN